MNIKIKDYDLAAGQARMRATLSRELGLGSRSYETDKIRKLTGPADVVRWMRFHVLDALQHLSVGEGGLATTAGASAYELTFDLPLVRAALMLAAHPGATPIEHHAFRGNQSPDVWENTKHDAGPVLGALFEKHGGTWNLRKFEATVWNAFVAAYGNETCSSEQPLNNFFAGSSISQYASILAAATLFDFFGAFDPAFSRQDALQGEWWLIQPVSPRLKHRILAERVDLKLAGYLPPNAVDAPGRVVMCCYRDDSHRDNAWREATLRDDKYVAGMQRVIWHRDQWPLSLPNFDLLKVTNFMALVPEADSYGPYKHSSDLPPWGADRDA